MADLLWHIRQQWERNQVWTVQVYCMVNKDFEIKRIPVCTMSNTLGLGWRQTSCSQSAGRRHGIYTTPMGFQHFHSFTRTHTCKQTHKHARLPPNDRDQVVHRKPLGNSMLFFFLKPLLFLSLHLFFFKHEAFSSETLIPWAVWGSVHARTQVLWKRRPWEQSRTMVGTGRGKKGSFVMSGGWTSPEGNCFL